MSFPTAPRYQGTPEQKSYLEPQFLRKAEIMDKKHIPIWNGEFGPVYANESISTDTENASINQERYNLLCEQLRIYDKYKIRWSIWLCQDIGLRGMIHTNLDSLGNKLIQPFLDKKKTLMLDHRGRDPDAAVDAVGVPKPLVEWIHRVNRSSKETYSTPFNTEGFHSEMSFRRSWRPRLRMILRDCCRGWIKTLWKSWRGALRFEVCVQREGPNEILKGHANVSGD